MKTPRSKAEEYAIASLQNRIWTDRNMVFASALGFILGVFITVLITQLRF